MGSTLYLNQIRLSHHEWYEGLVVTIEADVVNFDAPCSDLQSGLTFGLAFGSSCTCGSYPADHHQFGDYVVVYPACGETKTYIHKHTVTSADIDLITSGVKRCYALLSRGMNQYLCYERTGVTAKPPHVCDEGDERSPETCYDNSMIHKEVCRSNTWVDSGEECPIEPDDPCEGVVCEDVCYGVDKYQTECEEGVCIKGVLIKLDDPTCGYVPPEDPCKDVVCGDECYGKDKYETDCVNGRCIQGSLIQKDHPDCVYVPPDPDPDVEDYLIYVVIGVVIIGAYLLWRRK